MELSQENNVTNDLAQDQNNLTNNLEKDQNNFLDSTLWKTIDNGIDIGLRYILPDYLENEIIDIKDNLINYGLKEGISKTIESVVEKGKSAIGIVTGNFENVSQINEAVKSGGIIDSVSDLLDDVLNKVGESGKINDTVLKLIKNGKDAILNNVEKNIESTLSKQITGAENIEKYMDNWKDYYNKQDFSGMEKEYKKIESELKDLVPIENTISNARNIKILHNLIKNNGQDFNLSEEEKTLANKLSL